MRISFSFFFPILIIVLFSACSGKDMKQYGGNLAFNGGGNPVMAGIGLVVGGTLYGIGSLVDNNKSVNISDVQEILTLNGFILGKPFIIFLEEANVETFADYSYYLDNKNLRVDLKVHKSINCRFFQKIEDDWFLRNEYTISEKEELNSFKEKLVFFINN